MILKTPDGHYVELTKTEYNQFVVEIMVHFQRENKLELTFVKDARYEAAKMLLETVAKEGKNMEGFLRHDYMKTAYELIDNYNKDNPAKP
jgi:hypothetical protein